MTPKIRPMVAADLDAVILLAQRSGGAPYWTRPIYANAIEQEQTAALVAMADSRVAGFAVAGQVLDICELESIVVDPEFRRQGIGNTLLRAILAWSRLCGAHRLELEVRAGNTAAIALYRRAGFLRDGLRRSYYRDPEEDAVLMGLALDLPSEIMKKNP